MEILPKLNEMAGFSADEEIELYEVSLTFLSFLSNFSSYLTYPIWYSGNKVWT